MWDSTLDQAQGPDHPRRRFDRRDEIAGLQRQPHAAAALVKHVECVGRRVRPERGVATAAEGGLQGALQADRQGGRFVEGAGELLHQSDLSAATLRENVTSPKGTTAAALKVLMGRGGLTPLMKKAVAAARKRSRELSG